MNYAKNKAKEIVEVFILDDVTEPALAYVVVKRAKTISILCCQLIIKALDDIECDENQNVMESINEEEKFYNNVIKEIEKL